VMPGASWCLDPSKLPWRLVLKVSEQTYASLLRISG
jgi:hypothetical protein